MSEVAVVQTTPETYFDDVTRVMKLAGVDKLRNGRKTALKINLSWSKFFPSCSTAPYSYDGVLNSLVNELGFPSDDLFTLENETVVTSLPKGIQANRWAPVLKKYNHKFLELPTAEWETVKLKRKTLVLENYFGDIEVPKALVGSNVIHLPTIKTHGHTQMTGAMKNAFGMLLRTVRHRSHMVIHEVLVDLLMVQKEVCGELFTVTDGTIIGDGAGPRTMVPRTGNLLIASRDMVAADTTQCLLMGIDPFGVKKLVLAERGRLGTMNPDKIRFVGDFSSAGELPVTPTHPGKSPVIEGNRMVLNSPFWSILWNKKLTRLGPVNASMWYHDYFWYPLIGKSHIKDFLKHNPWGKLYNQYG